MANTFALGGSPLGLINVRSRPTNTGMSTFNAGKSRNMNVFSYNRGVSQPTGIQIDGKEAYSPVSLMSGGSLPAFFPNADIGKIGSEHVFSGIPQNDEVRSYQAARGVGVSSDLHNDAAYDTSLLNIIERLSKTKAGALRPQDFAYCKFLGVFPNNRLMIARRFTEPVTDSIFGKGGVSPKSILISWKGEAEDFLEFTFGEEWEDADADFTNVLNKLGKDFGISEGGGAIGKAFNLLPLPNFTEGFQRTILESIGVLDKNSGVPLPSGNPNIIKMAKRRKTIANGVAGAGLKCAISVAMTCEYEQKFISGIDPTTAFQDIINNIMIFGTSNSSNYGLSKTFEARIKKYATNPNQLVNDVIAGVTLAITTAQDELVKVRDKAYKLINERPKEGDGKAAYLAALNAVTVAQDVIGRFFKRILASVFLTISKYKIEIIGIANALSGSPSAPWHITLGNPLRPFFCSGDMLCESMSLKFGSMLAFNDLPSSVIATFALTNARALGMQEILAKFNSGSLRTVNVRKDYVEVQPVEISEKNKKAKDESGTYFDSIFDQSGNLISSAPTPPPGSSPSVVDPSLIPLGLTGTAEVEVLTLITSTGPSGESIISSTTSRVTLKDNGQSVALLDPGIGSLNLNPNQSVFNSFPVNGGPQL